MADGLEHYCSNCHHMTQPIGDPDICRWCHSPAVGLAPQPLVKQRAMGPITEPEDKEPTKHQRLKEGFALLHAAE